MDTKSAKQLPELAEALLNPAAYPEVPGNIELIQTQMSFVFLADKYVYKIKKEVNLGYLDYTTLESRRFFCHREVELNRRLSPEVYLGVVAVSRDDGRMMIEGKGRAIEYAVKMRRLPQERMMDVLLTQNEVWPEMVARVAEKLVDFHSRADTNQTISSFGGLEVIRQNTWENFSQTEKYVGRTISPERYGGIRAYTNDFICDKASLFHERVEKGKTRDCHGDLHAAHICFTNGISIYDCIEFNDRFRYGDVASEVAFLAMDLDHFGRADLSRHFVSTYVELSRDRELQEVLKFYKCYRAYVRGKVESFKLDDPSIDVDDKQQIAKAARDYFGLAWFYTRSKPVLFITSGLVGTGKTTLARALAGKLGLVLIDSDVTRKQLAGIPLTEHRFERFGAGIYSPEFTHKTYDEMFNRAEEILSNGDSVILDASFSKAEERLKAKDLAERTGADFVVIECILNEEIVRERLASRQEQRSISDAGEGLLEPQKNLFEPVDEVPDDQHVVVDTSRPVDRLLEEVELTRSLSSCSGYCK
ncbi:MAG: AAA family ATPase [Dehalococcoidia bacterium]